MIWSLYQWFPWQSCNFWLSCFSILSRRPINWEQDQAYPPNQIFFLDIDIEFKYWACVIKYANTIVKFWRKITKNIWTEDPHLEPPKAQPGQKTQAEMVSREPETNIAPNRLRKEQGKINQQGNVNSLQWI